MTRGSCIIALAALLLAPSRTGAQGAFFGGAGVAVTQAYESNVLAQPEPLPVTSDMASRLGPILEAGYKSNRFRTSGSYESALVERYWESSALNRRMSRQESHAEIALTPNRFLKVGAVGDYVDTYTPIELGVIEAFMLGRVHTQRLTVHPTFTYAWSNASSISAEYDYAREVILPFVPAFIQTPRVVLSHDVGRRTTARLSYRSRRFRSTDGPAEMSHAVEMGITQRIGRLSQIELDAGPRTFDRRLYPEVNALLRHPLRRGGELMVGYSETEGSVLGERGILEMRQVRAGLRLQIARPLRVEVVPTVFRAKRGDRSARIAALELTSVTQLASRLSLVVSGQAGRQQGDLGGAYNRIPYYTVTWTLRAMLLGGRDREPARAPAEPGAVPPQPNTGSPR